MLWYDACGFLCAWQKIMSAFLMVLGQGEQRDSLLYYVHWIEFNRRLDEWVEPNRINFAQLKPPPATKSNKKSGHGSASSGHHRSSGNTTSVNSDTLLVVTSRPGSPEASAPPTPSSAVFLPAENVTSTASTIKKVSSVPNFKRNSSAGFVNLVNFANFRMEVAEQKNKLNRSVVFLYILHIYHGFNYSISNVVLAVYKLYTNWGRIEDLGFDFTMLVVAGRKEKGRVLRASWHPLNMQRLSMSWRIWKLRRWKWQLASPNQSPECLLRIHPLWRHLEHQVIVNMLRWQEMIKRCIQNSEVWIMPGKMKMSLKDGNRRKMNLKLCKRT